MHESYFEPLDDKELHDHLRLQLPPTDAASGWSLDETAILEAIDYLGIKLPVRIRFMTSYAYKYNNYGEKVKKSWTGGTHYSRQTWHRVTINQRYKKTSSASETLWHELVHCMQAERFAERTGQSINLFHEYEYKKTDGEWGRTYEGNLMEIEANKIAAEQTAAGKFLCKGDR